jgi:putative two-component system hydrogenase maturation factor HypX/HoxX
MRILLLTHAFNCLTQRLFVELSARDHAVSVEFDINDAVSVEAVELFRPDAIVAPYLKRAIAPQIWRHHLCLVVHPGIEGDRGPAALDWAIMERQPDWGVTVLQANAELDGGDIWASAAFPMRPATKSSLYRNEVTEAATAAVLLALKRHESGTFKPTPLAERGADARGCWHPPMRQHERRIDWHGDSTATVLHKIRAADGFPGVLDELLGLPCYLFDAHAEPQLRGHAGEIVAHCQGAVCRATRDGAVWIGHLREKPVAEPSFKLPAAQVLAERLRDVPEIEASLPVLDPDAGYGEIGYRERDGVGYLHFDFYNGAMSTVQCQRLLQTYRYACCRKTRVIVLLGGADFWSNGIHLNQIEAADSPADESWRNINAMNDLAHALITTETHLTVAAMQGNAGAGGVFLALAADRVYARSGAVLNPHYKSMGNLYGSEYWTYLLPRRVGAEQAARLVDRRLPIGARAAAELGLLDACFGFSPASFRRQVEQRASALAADPGFSEHLAAKLQRRRQDERSKPLAQYRTEELERMRLNFYGFDPSYHVARYNFVFGVPESWTPLYLARHRSKSRAGQSRPFGGERAEQQA